MNKKSIFCFIMVFCLTKVCFAQTGSAGSTGLSFLKVGVGARATGMGEAFAAVSNDATATFWNPAGLAYTDKAQLAFTHTEWIEDITNEFLAFSVPAFHGVMGFSLYTSNIGGIERRVIPSETPIGTIDANDLSLGFSYARSFASSISAGVTLKYLYEKIYTESASGYAVDLGLLIKPFEQSFKFALVLQNFGSMNKLQEQAIELPETVRFGASYLLALQIVDGSVLFSVDGVKVSGEDLRANFGSELLLNERLAIRVGYQSRFEQKSFSGGLGLRFQQYQVDYGFTPFGSIFGDTHRFSARIEF